MKTTRLFIFELKISSKWIFKNVVKYFEIKIFNCIFLQRIQRIHHHNDSAEITKAKILANELYHFIQSFLLLTRLYYRFNIIYSVQPK